MTYKQKIESRLRTVKNLKSNCERVRKYKLKAYYDGEIHGLEWALEIKNEVLEKLKKFTLGLNGETHVDKAIKNCKCDACQVVNWIINEERTSKKQRKAK